MFLLPPLPHLISSLPFSPTSSPPSPPLPLHLLPPLLPYLISSLPSSPTSSHPSSPTSSSPSPLPPLHLLPPLPFNLPTPQSSNTQTRRRRQANTNTDSTAVDSNGYVTTCEARFIQVPDSGSYILVWACPEGVAEPSLAEQEVVCQLLFDRGLVTSCTSPTGVTVTRPTNGETQLPDTT